MLANLEETYRREAQDLLGEISAMQTRVEAVEAASSAADNRLLALEESQARQNSQLLMIQLQLEDMGEPGDVIICACEGSPKQKLGRLLPR